MKIYVAAHSQDDARKVAEKLSEAGHEITSTWLQKDFSRTSSYTEFQREQIANKDAHEVMNSDALVLLASPYRVPGGKFVEVGVALGLRKPIYLLGHRENMLMWHYLVQQFNSVEDMLKVVK